MMIVSCLRQLTLSVTSKPSVVADAVGTDGYGYDTVDKPTEDADAEIVEGADFCLDVSPPCLWITKSSLLRPKFSVIECTASCQVDFEVDKTMSALSSIVSTLDTLQQSGGTLSVLCTIRVSLDWSEVQSEKGNVKASAAVVY